VKDSPWPKRLLRSTRGQILSLLRTDDRTVDELATELRLTDNAVRAHLATLERDGMVARSGSRAGFRKPHATYALTLGAENVFSKSYGAVLDLVLQVVGRKVSPPAFRKAMREVGRKMAAEKTASFAGKTRPQRLRAALQVLHNLGGAPRLERSAGQQIIRSRSCPLAAATAEHPEACLIAESMLTQIVGVPVKQHCRRGPNPACCFQIQSEPGL
jgi:predicted ArsR family transcriptional regulator